MIKTDCLHLHKPPTSFAEVKSHHLYTVCGYLSALTEHLQASYTLAVFKTHTTRPYRYTTRFAVIKMHSPSIYRPPTFYDGQIGIR